MVLFLTCTALSYIGYACLRDHASPHAMLPQFQSAERFLPDTFGNKEKKKKKVICQQDQLTRGKDALQFIPTSGLK